MNIVPLAICIVTPLFIVKNMLNGLQLVVAAQNLVALESNSGVTSKSAALKNGQSEARKQSPARLSAAPQEAITDTPRSLRSTKRHVSKKD